MNKAAFLTLSSDHNHHIAGPFYPTYFGTPISPYYEAYNWDLAVQYAEEIQETVTKRVATIGKSFGIADPSDEAAVQEDVATADWFSGLLGPDEDATEPVV